MTKASTPSVTLEDGHEYFTALQEYDDTVLDVEVSKSLQLNLAPMNMSSFVTTNWYYTFGQKIAV